MSSFLLRGGSMNERIQKVLTVMALGSFLVVSCTRPAEPPSSPAPSDATPAANTEPVSPAPAQVVTAEAPKPLPPQPQVKKTPAAKPEPAPVPPAPVAAAPA